MIPVATKKTLSLRTRSSVDSTASRSSPAAAALANSLRFCGQSFAWIVPPIGRGEVLGPLMDVTRVAVKGGQIVGACLVVDREGTPPDGGPWVIDIFRDPSSPVRGVGTALLGAVLAAARSARLNGVSLAVSHQNTRALGLYTRLGFVDTGQSWTLSLPT